MIEHFHLSTVGEVERQGSMTDPSDALCLAQSALCHSTRKLEQHLGTGIWPRDGSSLRLTLADQAVLALDRRVLPPLEQAESQIRQMTQGEPGTLRVGMECHPCCHWLLTVGAP